MATSCRPPVSNGLVSAFTFDMEEDTMDASRHTPNDVTSARLRWYHHQCNTQLDTTLQLFRERQEHDRRARSRQCRSLLRLSCHSAPHGVLPDSRQWKLLRESRDICVYRLKARLERTSTVQAIGTLHGSLTDVMSGLYADSTTTARVLQLLLSPRSLDARVMQVDKRCTETKPFQFSGIVWMALKLPGLGFCRPRDFVCFKKMDVLKDEMGQEFGYMVVHSIDPVLEATANAGRVDAVGTTWPPMHETHDAPRPSATFDRGGSSKFVRGFISLALVFYRVEDDRVALFAYGRFNPSGHLSPFVGDKCIAEWLTSMANTVQSGRAKNLSRLLIGYHQRALTRADESVSRPRCSVCARALFFWDAGRACRGCWKVCCRACRIMKPIFCAHGPTVHGSSVPSGPCTETFCLVCVCAVIPSEATINARLLQRLATKRKRTPTTIRPPLTMSSITDGTLVHHVDARLVASSVSSISVLSSRESERYQQHRLSLNARPAKRALVQSDRTGRNKAIKAQATSGTELEVLHHFQMQRHATVSEASSSNAGTLRSFTSAEVCSTGTPTSPRLLGRYPSGHSLVTHKPSFSYRRASRVDRPRPCPGSFPAPVHGSFMLPRQATVVQLPPEATPELGDAEYQRLLHNYLLHATSSHSLASSYGATSRAIACVP